MIDEYLGAGVQAGKGNREAYLLALENTVNTANHAVLTGKAPKGATLRLRKQFASPTWESSFKDELNTTMTVGDSGKYNWNINQSTRPVVQAKLHEITEDKPVRSQTYEVGATTINGHEDHDFTITESDMDVFQVDLDWPLPDDFDLEVYKKEADGSLTQVGTSGNAPGEKERVEIAAPAPGDYVLRVVNFAAASPTYTLTATLFDSTVVSSEEVPGLIENWTLTCEKDGKVLEQVPVIINRGEQAKLNLSSCIEKWNSGN